MRVVPPKINWDTFGNIRFYEQFYSRDGRLMLKTGGNTAISQTGSKDVYRFEHDDAVRRSEEKPDYKTKLRYY